MIRISKLTDYAIVVLADFVCEVCAAPDGVRSVRDLATGTGLSMPTVSKLLKILTKAGLVVSRRGMKGGYTLSRAPQKISIASIIAAVEGPIALTDCGVDDPCALEARCPVRRNWQRINAAIRDALEHLTLSDMAKPDCGCEADADRDGGELPKLLLLAQHRRSGREVES
jgi:FeS assembly SUF system regulator